MPFIMERSPSTYSAYNYPEWSVESSILISALHGNWNAIETLVAQDSNINHCDQYGNTAIHYVVRGMHSVLRRIAQDKPKLGLDRFTKPDIYIKCPENLLEFGANPMTPNLQGVFPLHMATIKFCEFVDGPFGGSEQVQKPWAKFVQILSGGVHEKMLGSIRQLHQG